MTDVIKFAYTVFTVISVFFSSLFSPAVLLEPSENLDISFLEYPAEAITTLEQAGLTEKEFTERLNAELPEYVQSGGHEDVGGVVVSPYYTAKIGDVDIPVYASTVFIRSEDTGTLHSFSEVYVDPDEDFSFNIELKSGSVRLMNAIVLPSTHGVETVTRRGTVKASITKTGIYTFLFNGAQQRYGYTLFVREKIDEEAEIADYVSKYGAENVTVFENGVHEIDYLNFVNKSNQVIYLRQGAYLIAKHHYDIKSVEDEEKWVEDGAFEDNAIWLTRYPFMNFYCSENIVLTGRGAIDLTRLDRRERRGVVFNYCNNISVSSIKIINSPEWSFITYCCKNLTVEQVDIFGCRGNADGFAICNTENALITDCFVRTADDEFEVKALGGEMGSNNITFANCVAWGGYARCFGICGETSNPITNVTFRDSAVIYRDGVWDNDRIGSLVVVAEQCDGSIDGVLFENIEIFRDEGRPILVNIYDEEKENFKMNNIVYKNITCTAYMPSKIEGNASDTNTVQVRLENVTANSKLLTEEGRWLEIGGSCEVNFG